MANINHSKIQINIELFALKLIIKKHHFFGGKRIYILHI